MFGLDDLMGGVDDALTGGAGGMAQKYAQQGRDYLGATNVEAGPSAFASTDPNARAAQMEALGELQAKFHAGGLDAIDRARLGDIQEGVATSARTAGAGAEEDARHRGLYNSGNALVAQQVAGQGAATLGEKQGRDAAALAEQARMGAITGAAGVASGVRGQDYDKAAALDAIQRFNAAQRLSRAQGIADVGVSQGRIAQGDATRRYGMAKDIAKSAGSAMGGGGGGTPAYLDPSQLASPFGGASNT